MKRLALLLTVLAVSGCNYHERKTPEQPQGGDPQPVVGEAFGRVSDAVFAPKCSKCHNATNAKGGLDLTSYEAAMAAVVPGNPSESLLYNMIEWQEMPPRGALSADEMTLVREWILAGAPN